MQFAHLAGRLFNRPLALTPHHAEIAMAALADRFGITHLFRANGRQYALTDGSDAGFDAPAWNAGYQIVAGVAIIPVAGTLVQKLGYLQPVCGMTGYDGIRANLSLALEDPSVRAIVLDVDSPGGEVAGCFDLVDAIFAARAEKPIWSILTESAYSAGYAIASAASRVIVPRTGGTGSVGVIMLHVDMSQALSYAGLAVTLIHHGAQKTDGHPEIPLSAEALARFQADVDAMGELFVQTVARNRGLGTDAVRDTQAGIFLGAASLDVGFADAVMSPDAAFDELNRARPVDRIGACLFKPLQ